MEAGRAANGGQDHARADAENADTVQNLTEPATIAESELSPSAFSLPKFPAALLPQLKQSLHLQRVKKLL